ncbi:unnamed protein product [marine sediment metagenome]|uniref:Uncharacterized protein n=1 Tax=marine sediment metagenome TaxID=412755 RepID=X1SE74_9ZZZZ
MLAMGLLQGWDTVIHVMVGQDKHPTPFTERQQALLEQHPSLPR